MPMLYKPKAEGYDVPPPKIAPTSLLGDVFVSETDDDHKIACGFFKQLAGEEFVYTYTYEEMKIITEVVGTFTISDETGATFECKKGDVVYFKAGSTITFKVSDGGYAYAFYIGQRKEL